MSNEAQIEQQPDEVLVDAITDESLEQVAGGICSMVNCSNVPD
jgi:hypothetical protein